MPQREMPDLIQKIYQRSSTSSQDELLRKYTAQQIIEMMAAVFREEIDAARESANLETAALKAQLEKNKEIVHYAGKQVDELLTVIAAQSKAVRTGLPEDRDDYVCRLEDENKKLCEQLKQYFPEILALTKFAANSVQSRLESTRRLRKEKKDLEEALRQIPLSQAAPETRDLKLRKLYSAPYGIKRLEDEVLSGMQNGKPVSVAFLDVDHFKPYNETYRHGQGDQALTMLADIVSEDHRASDIVFRFGGDEIIFVFPSTEKDNAYKKLEHLQEKIRRTEIQPHPQIKRKNENYYGQRGYKHITASIAVIDATALDISTLRQQNEQSNNEQLAQLRAKAQGNGITDELCIERYIKENYQPHTLGHSVIQYLSELLETAKKDGRDKVLLG